MAREILFKAKAINRDKGYHRTSYQNGDWVHGLVTRLYDERFENLPAEMTDENGVSGIEIDHNTICQYTGLTDKNGNKIWENDVCSVSLILEDRMEKENCVVRYGRRAESFRIELGFNVEWTKTDYLRCDICFWTENREVVVIGNIFDNPELLGGADNG